MAGLNSEPYSALDSFPDKFAEDVLNLYMYIVGMVRLYERSYMRLLGLVSSALASSSGIPGLC